MSRASGSLTCSRMGAVEAYAWGHVNLWTRKQQKRGGAANVAFATSAFRQNESWCKDERGRLCFCSARIASAASKLVSNEFRCCPVSVFRAKCQDTKLSPIPPLTIPRGNRLILYLRKIFFKLRSHEKIRAIFNFANILYKIETKSVPFFLNLKMSQVTNTLCPRISEIIYS